MTLTATKTVREYALESPQTIPVFEKLGIDYCCGGNRPLEEACAAANLNIEEVLTSLETAMVAPSCPDERELRSGSLAELISHIVKTHHAFVRKQTPELEKLLEKVCSKHGQKHPDLLHLRSLFQGLRQELMIHMMKEEAILFPFIEHMEESVLQQEPILPGPFGSVDRPIEMMQHEHDDAGAALRAMRQATRDFTPPEDACTSFRALYVGLVAYEQDLHQHIHLENNVLFPRAAEMEHNHQQA